MRVTWPGVHWPPNRHFPRSCTTICSMHLASACRRASRCWDTRSPGRAMTCGPDTGAITSSGTGQPMSRPGATSHRRAWAPPRHFHPAATHPGSDHCGATRSRGGLGTAVPHRAGSVRSPVSAADLRFRSLRTCTPGSVALIGDAAFVVRPHVGAGVAKAAQDAAALAQALATARSIEAALGAFQADAPADRPAHGRPRPRSRRRHAGPAIHGARARHGGALSRAGGRPGRNGDLGFSLTRAPLALHPGHFFQHGADRRRVVAAWPMDIAAA